MELYICVFLLMMVLITQSSERRRTAATVKHIIEKKKKTKGDIRMKELAQKFVGKECLIYTVINSDSCIKGKITEVTDTGIIIENAGNTEAVNLEYVIRIREWPRDRNGKKKMFVG